MDHKAICTIVARMPAAMPAHSAALKFAELCIGRGPAFKAETRTAARWTADDRPLRRPW